MRSLTQNITPAILLMRSCYTETMSPDGFEGDFTRYAEGIAIVSVNRNASKVLLSGEVFIEEGEAVAELIAPTGKMVFAEHFKSSHICYVHESFPAIPGNWRLKYRSINGEGTVSLHLKKIIPK